MIAKIDTYDFYLYSDFRNGSNPLNLIQLIAHAEDFTDDSLLSEEEKELYQKRNELCEIVFEDEWTSRNGKIQFLIEFSERKYVENYYNRFIKLLQMFGLDSEIANLRKTVDFYIKYEQKIKELEENEGNDDWWDEVQILEKEYTYHYSTTNNLANLIVENPEDYCRDEKGNIIEANFTGKKKRYLDNGVLSYEYTIVNGQILGDYISYYKNGLKKELLFVDGYFHKELIKKWFSNGQIAYEKIGDTDFKYWYENGQLQKQRIGDVIKKWDETGNEIK
ncbi:hypothetical protein [Tenacibaculum sp. M341]|uniref:hypothetical protein n=1 Tax=Tenacibaculum sp. M341 TaxID=2530339 RepID=UPI001043B794|nr:hypothetical protein [Tenacibaculum sp. M341]TCI92609.1 hypothetical protein EYW44_06825 [Tenacibaculum sp. M341]